MITSLSFAFRGKNVPVTYRSSTISKEQAEQALASEPFQTWIKRCETKHESSGNQLLIESVELQSIDFFGARGVGFIKLKSICRLVHPDGSVSEKTLPGICFLRGSAVCIFVALFCGDHEYALLVRQPRVPIGMAQILEIPAGMIDDLEGNVTGIAVKEMEEECGIVVEPGNLVDLTALALQDAYDAGNLPVPAIAPSPGACDEFCRFMYLEKEVTQQQLDNMRDRITGLRDHGEYITLQVVEMNQVWKQSGDVKAMVTLFLLDQLRREGKIPPAGQLVTPLHAPAQPKVTLNYQMQVDQLAFGLYKVPGDEKGKRAVLQAIRAGYRHLDGAAFYGNERVVGEALRESGVPRQDFCLVTKVWNDAVKQGRDAVRASVLRSLNDINYGEYFDIVFVHWPVPGYFVDAYLSLEELVREGKIRALGISNFCDKEYEELETGGMTIMPIVNQFEVSPVMYRPDLVNYFQKRSIAVSAYKPLNRGGAFDQPVIRGIAERLAVTPAQVMLRWALQKNLIVVAKTMSPERMAENRALFHFHLSDGDMAALDACTTANGLSEREQHEHTRKTSL